MTTPTLPSAYVDQMIDSLQIEHGIAHVETLKPVLEEILKTAKNVRVVLLACDILASRMKHAFLASKDESKFPLDVAACYLYGRSLATGVPITPEAVREEVKTIDAEKFVAGSEQAREWMEALTEAESIVARVQASVRGILESAEINIVQFVGRYGDRLALDMVRFIQAHQFSDIVTKRARAFGLVQDAAGKDPAIEDLPTRHKLSLAMAVVHLCDIHAGDIMDTGVQGKSSYAFIDKMRSLQKSRFIEWLRSRRINPKSLFPDVELTPEQAALLIDPLVKDAEIIDLTADQRYVQASTRLRNTILSMASFGISRDHRKHLADECLKNFTEKRYQAVMEFFGYRVIFPAKPTHE